MRSVLNFFARIFGGRPVETAEILRKKIENVEKLLDEIENEKSNHKTSAGLKKSLAEKGNL